MIKNKKAQGHVEIILSFSLFIGALVFLFLFINPFAEVKEISVIKGIQERIINEMSSEVGKMSVVVGGEGGCYDFDEGDYEGRYIEKQDPYDLKFTIYFNNIFENTAPNKNVNCGSTYTLGIYSVEKMIVFENIESFVADYSSDYNGLKNSLGIVGDFTISFRNLVHEKIDRLSTIKEPPIGVNVEAKDIPVRVINNNGEILEFILNIKAWD